MQVNRVVPEDISVSSSISSKSSENSNNRVDQSQQKVLSSVGCVGVGKIAAQHQAACNPCPYYGQQEQQSNIKKGPPDCRAGRAVVVTKREFVAKSKLQSQQPRQQQLQLLQQQPPPPYEVAIALKNNSNGDDNAKYDEPPPPPYSSVAGTGNAGNATTTDNYDGDGDASMDDLNAEANVDENIDKGIMTPVIGHRKIRRMSASFFNDARSVGGLSTLSNSSTGACSSFGAMSSMGSMCSSEATYDMPPGHTATRGNATLFKIIEQDFTARIASPDVRRVLQLCFSALAVVFVETLVPKNGVGPFTYTRMPGVPAGAARMLWRALLGSDVSPLEIDSEDDDASDSNSEGRGVVEYDAFHRIRRDASLNDTTVHTFFDEMRKWRTPKPDGKKSATRNKMGGIGSILFGLAGGGGVRAADANGEQEKVTKGLSGSISALSLSSKGQDSDMDFDEPSQASTAATMNNRGVDTFYRFIRSQLADVGVIEVCGKGDDDLDDASMRDEAAAPVPNNQSASDTLGVPPEDNGNYSDADTSGWEKQKRRKLRRRKKRTQYLQIQRDMEHQYGVYLSGLPVEEGGFAIARDDGYVKGDLDHDGLAALAREHDTMQTWNGLMADECLKKSTRRRRRIKPDSADLLVGFPSRGGQAEDGADPDGGTGSAKRKPWKEKEEHEPWIFKDTSKWPIDDATRYALHMLPAHLMRAGRVAETSELLSNGNFFTGRVRTMGVQKGALVHRQDLEEMERRITLASAGYDDVGGDGHAADSTKAIAAACEMMITHLTKTLTSIKTVERKGQDQGQNSSETRKKERVSGEKVRGETGRALHGIAWFLGKKGHSDEAIACYTKSLKYKQLSLGSSHNSVAGTLHNMGNLHLDRNEYEEATQCYCDALSIERQKQGNKHNIATTLNSLGMIYGMTLQLDEAVKVYEEVISVEKELYGINDLRCADTLNNLGIIQGIKGDYDKAVHCYAETLRIKRSQLGEFHSEVADSLFSLGIVHTKRGDYHGAVDSYQASLRVRKEILGEDHEEVARVLHCLGIVLSDMGEVDNSIRCYEESLRIRLLRLGDDHEDVARTLNNLGLVYYKSEDYNRAMECFKGTLRVSKQKLGNDHEKIGDTLNSMGQVYTRMRKLDNARDCFLEALRIRRIKLGNDNLDTGATLHNLGDVYYMISSFDNAMECYKEAFRIRLFKLGTESVEVASTRNNMGVVHLKKGDNQRAMECFSEALRVRILRLGESDDKVGDTLHNMGLVHKNLKQYEEAIERYSSALKLRKEKKGEGCLKVADTLYNMGVVYANSGNYSRALDRYREALRTYREAGLPHDHPSLVNTMQWINWAQKRLDKKSHT